MKTWQVACRYQGIGGISRGILLIRQGGANSRPLAVLRPRTPPTIVSGSVTSAHMTMMTMIVPKGRAACELYAMATVLRKQNMHNKGAGNSVAASTRFQAQRPSGPKKRPNACADTKPAVPAVSA